MKLISFKTVSYAILVMLSAITLTLNRENADIKTVSEDIYVLKSYKNTVALYKNGEIQRIYDDIVINTLPVSDVILLNKGIVIENLADLSGILEDYDG